MSEAMIQLMGEVQAKEDLIDTLTAERDSFKTCFGIVSQENERLRKRLEQTHRNYVAAAREREISRATLHKVRTVTGETLRAIEPQTDDPPPRVAVFNRNSS